MSHNYPCYPFLSGALLGYLIFPINQLLKLDKYISNTYNYFQDLEVKREKVIDCVHIAVMLISFNLRKSADSDFTLDALAGSKTGKSDRLCPHSGYVDFFEFTEERRLRFHVQMR